MVAAFTLKPYLSYNHMPRFPEATVVQEVKETFGYWKGASLIQTLPGHVLKCP